MSISLKPYNVETDSTIDEKIDSLVEWRRKYPKIKITPIATDEELREYAKTDEEFNRIQEEYEKMQRYYEYVRYKKYQGKLNEEQMSRGKEGEIGGVFGFPAKVEELAKKYNIEEKDIDYLLTKYGTLDNFYEMHNAGEIEGEKDNNLEGIIIRNLFDIDGNSSIGYDNLYRDIFGRRTRDKGVFFYSSKELQNALEKLSEREKYVIESLYGLKEGKIFTTKKMAEELGITESRVRQIKNGAVWKLKKPSRSKKVKKDYVGDNYKHLTDDERQQIEEIKKNIQLQNGDFSENLAKLKKIGEEVRKRKEVRKKEELKRRIIESELPPIKELISFSYDDLLDLGIEPRLAGKISLEIERTKKEKAEQLSIRNGKLLLSIRTSNCLLSVGINSLGDLANMTEEQLRNVKGLGKESYNEVVSEMRIFGISFKEDDEQENIQEKQNNTKEQTEKTSYNIAETEEQVVENNKTIKDINEILKQSVIKRIREQQKSSEKQREGTKQHIIEDEQLSIEKLISFSYDDLLDLGIEPRSAAEISLEIDRIREGESEKLNIDNMGFSIRAQNALKRVGIDSLGDLANMTEEELKRVRGLGSKCLDEIVAKMQEKGVSFKTEEVKKERIEQHEETEKIDNVRVETEKNGTETTTDTKIETQETVVENNEQQQEKMNYEDMPVEELQKAVQQNDKTIEDNDKAIKQELIKRLLEQQKIIERQQAEIDELSRQKGALE